MPKPYKRPKRKQVNAAKHFDRKRWQAKQNKEVERIGIAEKLCEQLFGKIQRFATAKNKRRSGAGKDTMVTYVAYLPCNVRICTIRYWGFVYVDVSSSLAGQANLEKFGLTYAPEIRKYVALVEWLESTDFANLKSRLAFLEKNYV